MIKTDEKIKGILNKVYFGDISREEGIEKIESFFLQGINEKIAKRILKSFIDRFVRYTDAHEMWDELIYCVKYLEEKINESINCSRRSA